MNSIKFITPTLYASSILSLLIVFLQEEINFTVVFGIILSLILSSLADRVELVSKEVK
ncbi:hypothetical protein V7166_22960 [Bacillus thuringiensis]